MKLSVSLPDDDVEFIDREAAAQPGGSRSSVLHAAVSALRERQLAKEYALAAVEWAEGDGADWEAIAGEGIS